MQRSLYHHVTLKKLRLRPWQGWLTDTSNVMFCASTVQNLADAYTCKSQRGHWWSAGAPHLKNKGTGGITVSRQRDSAANKADTDFEEEGESNWCLQDNHRISRLRRIPTSSSQSTVQLWEVWTEPIHLVLLSTYTRDSTTQFITLAGTHRFISVTLKIVKPKQKRPLKSEGKNVYTGRWLQKF